MEILRKHLLKSPKLSLTLPQLPSHAGALRMGYARSARRLTSGPSAAHRCEVVAVASWARLLTGAPAPRREAVRLLGGRAGEVEAWLLGLGSVLGVTEDRCPCVRSSFVCQYWMFAPRGVCTPSVHERVAPQTFSKSPHTNYSWLSVFYRYFSKHSRQSARWRQEESPKYSMSRPSEAPRGIPEVWILGRGLAGGWNANDAAVAWIAIGSDRRGSKQVQKSC